MLSFSLPYPPTINTYWRNFRGRIVIAPEGRKYRERVALTVMAAGAMEPLRGRVRCWIMLFPPDRRKRDIDNPVKALLDALTRARVWLDDSQIDALIVQRESVWKPHGKCEIKIEEMDSEKEVKYARY